MPTAMVVLAHPDPASFNHAVAEAIGSGLRTAGFDVRLHDLYGEGFDPLVRARTPGADLPSKIIRRLF